MSFWDELESNYGVDVPSGIDVLAEKATESDEAWIRTTGATIGGATSSSRDEEIARREEEEMAKNAVAYPQIATETDGTVQAYNATAGGVAAAGAVAASSLGSSIQLARVFQLVGAGPIYQRQVRLFGILIPVPAWALAALAIVVYQNRTALYKMVGWLKTKKHRKWAILAIAGFAAMRLFGLDRKLGLAR